MLANSILFSLKLGIILTWEVQVSVNTSCACFCQNVVLNPNTKKKELKSL